MKRLLLACTILAWQAQAASAAVVQITTKDASGVTRNFNVTTNSDITGNLSWNNTICDQATGATCASVGTAGSPSTNALTVQGVTLGHGTAANAMRVELPTDGTGLVLSNPGTIGSWGLQSSTQNSSTPTNGQLALGQFNTSPTTITSGNVSPLQMNSGGNLLVSDTALLTAVENPIPTQSVTMPIGGVGIIPGVGNGCTPTHYLSAASNNATNVKASAGTVCSVTIVQNTTTAASFRLYNTATTPTCSSATGVVANYGVQANTTSPGLSPNLGPFGLAFSTGIGFCLTAYDGTDTNNSNSVTGIQIDIGYN